MGQGTANSNFIGVGNVLINPFSLEFDLCSTSLFCNPGDVITLAVLLSVIKMTLVNLHPDLNYKQTVNTRWGHHVMGLL